MGEFDYKLFHTLFDKICAFDAFLDDEEEIEGAKVEDAWDKNKADITGCLHLSIFGKLKKMCDSDEFVRGENVDLVDYLEIKDGDKIVGAKGIMSSNMDRCDADEPQYYYEFAHLETDGKVEEYIRELHIDEVVMKVLSASFGDKITPLPKGRDESKKLIDLFIKNSKDTIDIRGLKYRCLLEGKQDSDEYVEIWKLGYTEFEKSYRLLILGPQFLRGFDEDAVLNAYLQDQKLGSFFGSFEKMSEEELAEIQVWEDDGTWYHKGKIELEAEKEKKKAKKSKAEKISKDMDAILNPDGPNRDATKELIDALSSSLKSPTAGKYAKELIEKVKKGYKIQSGEDF
jgi:hypothetical protein